MLTKENGFELPLKLTFPNANKYAFAFISLFVILIAVYSNGFYGEWQFDDFYNIVENPYIQIKSLSYDNIKNTFYGISQERLSRPLSYFSFAINYYFGGLDTFGYHIVNFFIHYLAAIFLFLFIYNALKLPLSKERYTNIAYPVAMLATFLWALHPIQVTSVTYIVQRMSSMSGLFYIMSMYFYLKGRTTQNSISSISFFVLSLITGFAALLSKENAVMLPVSILLFDLLLIQGTTKENINKFIKILFLPLLLILMIGFIYTGGFSNVLAGYEGRNFSMMQRMLTEPRIILFYLSLLFYPINSRLTLLYDIDISRSLFQPWTTIPSILLILLIIIFAFYIARKRPFFSFCIIFYFLNHLIEGSILPLELIFEHRNYLPSMLLFIPIAELIIYAIDYFSYKKIIQFTVACGIFIIIFGLGDITYRRNAIVSNEFILWMDNINKYPNLSRHYSSLGTTYMLNGQKEKGLYNYKMAMAMNNFANPYARALTEHNLGIYYFREGFYGSALSYFKRASKFLSPFLPNAIYVAKIHLLKNEYSAARLLIEPLLKKYPGNHGLNEIFCLILFKENNFIDAEIYAKKYLKRNLLSTFPLLVLAETARKKGNFQSAILYWRLYQQSSPLSPYANLALLELFDQTNDNKMLYEELAKLCCLKKNLSLTSYLEEISHNQNLLIYIPDSDKIKKIFMERSRVNYK